jgi:LysM repeat protein
MRSILQNQKIAKRSRALPGRPVEHHAARSKTAPSPRWLRRIPITIPIAVVAVVLSGSLIAWKGIGWSSNPSEIPAPIAAARDAAQPAVGTGAPERDPNVDLDYTVQDGETLSEIAYVYKLDFTRLAVYNNLSNPSAIKPGQHLVIPSVAHAQTIRIPVLPKSAGLAIVTRPEPGQQVRIDAAQQNDGRSVTAHFTLEQPPDTKLVRYEWDLGDNHRSFRDGTYWTYDKPGTYNVSLKAWDDNGKVHSSNTIYITVPHPGAWATGDQRFITLDEVGQPFDVPGEVTAVLGYPSLDESPIVRGGAADGVQTYVANQKGFYNLTVDKDGEISHIYLFVSPIPSRNVDRPDMDWYRTQFNTGTQSNCGPSMIAMAISWALGDYVPVAQVRQTVGWTGDGGIGFEDMIRVLKSRGVKAELKPAWSPDDVRKIIDQGQIAILLYNTMSVRRASGDPTQNLFGTYYKDNVGHYVLIKGYSLDRKWFVVYDPIPSDWSSNSVRYSDGISMIGRNRYYAATELFATIRVNQVLAVTR